MFWNHKRFSLLFSVAWEVLPRISILHFLKLLQVLSNLWAFSKEFRGFINQLRNNQQTRPKQLLFTLFYTFDQTTFRLPAILSSNGCEIRVFWPQLHIVWHQARPIWLILKARWFMRLFPWRSIGIRGLPRLYVDFQNSFSIKFLIGQHKNGSK